MPQSELIVLGARSAGRLLAPYPNRVRRSRTRDYSTLWGDYHQVLAVLPGHAAPRRYRGLADSSRHRLVSATVHCASRDFCGSTETRAYWLAWTHRDC
jgi:hypothetical protein